MPRIVSSGVDPIILEYIDVLAMAGITASAGLDLGIPEEIKASDAGLSGRGAGRDHAGTGRRGRGRLASSCRARGPGRLRAPSGAGPADRGPGEGLLRGQGGRGRRHRRRRRPAGGIPGIWPGWPNWPAGTVRSSPAAVTSATATSTCRSSSPTRNDATRCSQAIFETAIAAGGAVSGEHGIGTEKLTYFLDTEDPVSWTSCADQAALRPPRDPRARTAPRPHAGHGVNGARTLLSTLVAWASMSASPTREPRRCTSWPPWTTCPR